MSSDEAMPPVDAVFAALRSRFPDLVVDRLKALHPADDDNLWYVRAAPDAAVEIQIETWPEGQPPFLIESGDDQRVQTSSPDEAVDVATDWLRAT